MPAGTYEVSFSAVLRRLFLFGTCQSCAKIALHLGSNLNLRLRQFPRQTAFEVSSHYISLVLGRYILEGLMGAECGFTRLWSLGNSEIILLPIECSTETGCIATTESV